MARNKNTVSTASVLTTLIMAGFCILSIIAIILSIIAIVDSKSNTTTIINQNPSLNWVESPLSPIYNPYNDTILDEDYFPYVIYDPLSFSGHGGSFKYKMWHQGVNDSIALSYSNDGISWFLAGLTNLTPAFHACVLYSANKFNGTFANYYRIYFWTGSVSTLVNVIQTAGSDDGITWTNISSISQNPSFPLVDGIFPGFFYHNYGPSFIRYNGNPLNISGLPYTFPYVLFYDIASENGGPGTSQEAIGLAYSYDGFNFTRYGSLPVLVPLGSTSTVAWDGTHAFRPSLIFDSVNNIYHLYYSASNYNIDTSTSIPYAHGIGHAISHDGVTWSIDWTNPIFYYNNGNQWRNLSTYTPFVLNFNGNLVMWFNGGHSLVAGQGQGIGYATCNNCL